MAIQMKNILPISTVKRDFLRLIKQVEEESSPIVITRDGRAAGVLMSVEEYEGILETMELLKDPNFLDRLKEAEEDLKAGRVHSFDEVFPDEN